MKTYKAWSKGTMHKNFVYKTIRLIMVLTLMLALVSCESTSTKQTTKEVTMPSTEIPSTPAPSMENNSEEVSTKKSEVIGDFKYPENPAEQLKISLQKDIINRGLPMEISDVEKIEFNKKECQQITIKFTGDNKNICVITFITKDNGYENSLDGHDNPSFTIAFKDPDNSQDMITVLTSVIKYLSPDLSLEDAAHMAAKQNNTISTDGYSMPQDIGGYQVQARYSNPHVFFSTPNFDSQFGVEVRAIKQLWNGAINPSECKELKNPDDFNILTEEYSNYRTSGSPMCVYSDFIVKNVWQGQSYIHGETWVTVDMESMTGQQYSFSINTWDYTDPYEFGVGQKYTIFMHLNDAHAGIIYAIQRTSSEQFNSRGEVQPIDYPDDDLENPLTRIEPEGNGTIYNVSYLLESQSYGDEFAVLAGHGIGAKQWPKAPFREGYTFDGWYDNADLTGNSYTKDTPIYKDTDLYAKWKYTGSGGTFPRACFGKIGGISEGSKLDMGQKIAITANGYNMNLESPKDQRFRWYPVSWRISDGTKGDFSKEMPFQSSLTLGSKGGKQLYVTYKEEIFDGVNWQKTGKMHEALEVTFQVN